MSSENFGTFLLEVGVEEIPSRFLGSLAEEFGARLQGALQNSRLLYHDVGIQYTPRRLIFQAQVAASQSAEVEVVRGPAASIAWKEGQATDALRGFLRRVQLAEDSLGRQTVAGKEYVTASLHKPVHSARETIPGLIAKVLATLPQPRSMRWNGDDYRFIRPVRWVLALWQDTVLEGQALGVDFGRATYGNRTDHPQAMAVDSVSQYWQALREGKVLADPSERRQMILRSCEELAREVGGTAELDQELLAEVINLVEWPTTFVGRFEEEFLRIPEPILVTSMRVHQRYFPVRSASGPLLPYFLAVRNGEGEELDLVRRGNQKVLRARLSDARYFFANDRKQRLAEGVQALGQVTLHGKLGTYADKVERMRKLFERTRGWWELNPEEENFLRRAITLYKCDLLTQVVGEFPELQGEMGGIYARLDGEDGQVSDAIRSQYRPASGKDDLPEARVSQILGLLDRVDTLIAFYQANIRATGSEDPFGLRRAALGVARLLSETELLGGRTPRQLLQEEALVLGATDAVVDDVMVLVQSRLESQWEDRWPHNLLRAVLAREFPWARLFARLSFLREKRVMADGVANAYKRITRIVDETASPQLEGTFPGIEGELREAALKTVALEEEELQPWWLALQEMVPLVERFFDEVLVMDPDLALRARRLAVLNTAREAMGRYCDWDWV